MSSKRQLRIGIDFHGVITEAPVFFRDFTTLAFDKDYEIYIISGGPYQVEKNFLDAWHIKYTHIFSLLEHFISHGQVTYFENGNFKVPDELWNKAKAQYCFEHNIDIQIDDTSEYGKNFSTPFCLFNAQTSTCEIGTKTISFKESASETLKEIEDFILNKN